MIRSIILGAGTYGEVYLHYLRESGIDIIGFLDDDPGKHNFIVDGVPVLGPIDDLENMGSKGVSAVYAPVGNNVARRQMLQKARTAGLITPSYIHPDSVISSDIRVGETVYILPGTVIMPKVSLGDAVMISMGVRLAHHTAIGAGVFLSTGVAIGAGINVGDDAYFGMNVTAVTGKCKTVGPGAFIGACSNLLSDIPAGAIAVGNPARLLAKD